MSTSGSRVLGLLAGVLLLSVSHAGASTLTVSSSVGGAPTGINYVNFDNLALGSGGGVSGGVTVSMTPDAQVVVGAAGGLYAAPVLSNNNGVLFSDPTNGVDATRYITSGSNGSAAGAEVTMTFGGPELYMGLLWGSVDNYNTLSFYNGATFIGSITGLDVTANPTGDQGVNGTFYVNISSTLAFNKVVASSTQYAFEFDNVSYSSTVPPGVPVAPTPLPGALWLFGTVVAGAAGASRLRRRQLKVA